jgi:hypothetical protein
LKKEPKIPYRFDVSLSGKSRGSDQEVFCFFSSEKKALLYLPHDWA